MERFHALPMWTPAVLVGRTLADLLRNVFVVILMMVVGFLVGWRIHTSLLALVPGVLSCCCSASRCRGSSPPSGSP